MSKIKVAHILHSVGGVDVSLRLITGSIDNKKVQNIIIHGTKDTDKPFLDKSGNQLNAYQLPIGRNINPIKDLWAAIKAIKVLKAEKPDLIHAHSAKGGVLGKIVGWLIDIPVLHTPQAYSYLSATGAKKRVFLMIEKSLIGFKNNKILASSNSERNRAINDLGYPRDRVLLFNNCIHKIDNVKPISIKKNWPDRYICSVGRPSFQKNIELMLKVIEKVKEEDPSIHLVLMGVGYHSPNLNRVKIIINNLKLNSNVTLLEWTNREDIFNIIAQSKLYLSTARYEGLPYSIIESLSLGIPIIASDADGNRDLVIDQFNGFLIKEDNEEKFADAVIEIMSNDDLCIKFSNNSKKIFHENFDIEKNIQELETIYLKNKKT